MDEVMTMITEGSEIFSRHFYCFPHQKDFIDSKIIVLKDGIQVLYNKDFTVGGEGIGQIYHGYVRNIGKCTALKVVYNTAGETEVQVLKHFKSLPDPNEKHLIIEMYGYQKKSVGNTDIMLIALELGDRTLEEYYDSLRCNTTLWDNRETVITKGTARALEQFHKEAIHHDVKIDNFVVMTENQSIPVIKLKDFNKSVLLGDKQKLTRSEINSIKKDVRAFGLMILGLTRAHLNGEYEEYLEDWQNSYFDRVMKGCLQTSHKRPTMHAIVKFLDGNCDYFKYEGKIGDNRCD